MKKLSLLLALCAILAAGALYATSGTTSATVTTPAVTMTSSTFAVPACGNFATPSWAASSVSPARTCPFEDLVCATIYDPVICATDGQVYSNACVAKRNCAFGCVPYNP